jgi:hypothetical protein
LVQICRTRNSACRHKATCHSRKIELREGFSDAASGSYPAKTIAKNFVSLITYPHSDSKHFEKPPPAKRTYIFYENFLREPRYL